MRNQQLKCQTIRQIQRLQLTENWIQALEDVNQVSNVLAMLDAIEDMSAHWN